ncbi:MAG: flagellar biosynthetic protein FliO [Acidimicrobiales bacterium]
MGASLLAFGRMLLVLGLIIGALMVLARYGKKWQRGGGIGGLGAKPAGRIEVLSRRSLGRHISLLVVRVAQRTFLVGQSNQQMTLLAELDGDEWVEPGPSTATQGLGNDNLLAPRTASGAGGDSPGAWDAFMDRLREMTVRH